MQKQWSGLFHVVCSTPFPPEGRFYDTSRLRLIHLKQLLGGCFRLMSIFLYLETGQSLQTELCWCVYALDHLYPNCQSPLRIQRLGHKMGGNNI